MIFIVTMSLLLLIFLPKLFFMRKKRKEKNEASNGSTSGIGNTMGSTANQVSSSTKSKNGNAKSNTSSVGVGLRIVSAVSYNEPESTGREDEYESLKKELAACKEQILKLEQERRNTAMISEEEEEEFKEAEDVGEEFAPTNENV